MDSSSNLEFFDFENASEEEIKKIQGILTDPETNGCVELPWETNVTENLAFNDIEGSDGNCNLSPSTAKPTKHSEVVGHALHFVPPQVPPMNAQLMDALVTLPTSIGPYPNAPYFVSRTVPYLRAFPHMGVPFFACPISGTEANPYGQFLPMMPAAETAKNAVHLNVCDRGHSKSDNKKQSPNVECCSADESSSTEQLLPTSRNELPSSVPLPPSTFTAAIPLHGYPPGLPTLPYTQAPMYYVPVFNHPYGSYMASTSPVVLPLNVSGKVIEAEGGPPKQSEPSLQSQPYTDDATSLHEDEECNSSSEDVNSLPENSCNTVQDTSRRWADLFKKNHPPQVNGIDRPAECKHTETAIMKLKTEITNGEVFSVPGSSNSIH